MWVLALAIIPPLCNTIIGPLMKKIDKTKKTPSNEPLAKPMVADVQRQNSFSVFPSYTKINTGMRI